MTFIIRIITLRDTIASITDYDLTTQEILNSETLEHEQNLIYYCLLFPFVRSFLIRGKGTNEKEKKKDGIHRTLTFEAVAFTRLIGIGDLGDSCTGRSVTNSRIG